MVEINTIEPFAIQAPIVIQDAAATELKFILPEGHASSMWVRLRADQPWKLVQDGNEYPFHAMEELETVLWHKRDTLWVQCNTVGTANLYLMVNTQQGRV